MIVLPLACALMILPTEVHGESSAGGTARWIAEQASWGSVAFVNETLTNPSVSILPFAASAEHNGRLFMYLMGDNNYSESSLTLSQASLNSDLFDKAGCGTVDSAVDAQDPRCIKATFTGAVEPCSGKVTAAECEQIGKDALFAKHPAMKNWPENHHFSIHEFIVNSIWMISSFGGGSQITSKEYATSRSSPHDIKEGTKVAPLSPSTIGVPEWSELAARARWIVYHSLWTTVSTRGGEGSIFGNIRSVTDGSDCVESTGRPYFYLPDADPAAQAIRVNDHIALSFSEASLYERVTASGQTCGGEDAGSPLCGQVVIHGSAVHLEAESPLRPKVLSSFAVSHPLAPWLAEGGSHMEGKYYTIQVDHIMLLDYFGGYQQVDLGDYLQFIPADHEEFFNCSTNNANSENHDNHHNALWFMTTFILCSAFLWICISQLRTSRCKVQTYQPVQEMENVAFNKHDLP